MLCRTGFCLVAISQVYTFLHHIAPFCTKRLWSQTTPFLNWCMIYAVPMTDAKKDDTLETGLGCLVIIGLLVWGGGRLWQRANDSGWLPHDTLAIVNSKNWSAGEYKTCSEANITPMKEEPQIDCSSYAEYGEEPKRFKVCFYGPTYKEELKDKVSFSWRCKKNGGESDPTFTCDDQKIIRWDEKK
jgi:hypothetical protein